MASITYLFLFFSHILINKFLNSRTHSHQTRSHISELIHQNWALQSLINGYSRYLKINQSPYRSQNPDVASQANPGRKVLLVRCFKCIERSKTRILPNAIKITVTSLRGNLIRHTFNSQGGQRYDSNELHSKGSLPMNVYFILGQENLICIYRHHNLRGIGILSAWPFHVREIVYFAVQSPRIFRIWDKKTNNGLPYISIYYCVIRSFRSSNSQNHLGRL